MLNCYYCTLPNNLVKCIECNKTFCNAPTTSSVSHIIFHLVKARHKRIDIGRLVDCEMCGEANIFILGSKNGKIVCRQCGKCQTKLDGGCDRVDNCVNDAMTVDNTSNIENEGYIAYRVPVNKKWESLIEERCLVSWLLNADHGSSDNNGNDADLLPSPAKNLSMHQLLAMEEKEKPKLTAAKKRYTPAEHIEILTELIKAEAESEKNIKESLTKYNMSVRWENSNRTCYFVINRDDIVKRINTGDEIKLSGPNFVARGFVCNDSAYTEEVVVDVVKIEGEPPILVDKIEFLWKNVGYERMARALGRFGKTCSRSLYKYILNGECCETGLKESGSKSGSHKESKLKSCGKKSSGKNKVQINEILQPENLPKLNSSQEIAVKAALNKNLTLIQGPPGTGKTITCAAIVYNLVKRKKGKILVAAPSNTAVDNLTKQIAKTGVKVVRVMSKSREWSDAGSFALHEMVKLYEIENYGTCKNESDEKYDRMLKQKAEDRIIENAEVVTCTCVTAGQRLFYGVRFPNVLIDEAVQCTEPLAVIPLTHGCKKLIMVGDHKQLGPTILDRRTEQAGLKISMFERLAALGVHPYLLTVQYRMHPLLSEWPSNTFYHGSLMNGLSEVSRTSVLKMPTFFYVCYGREEVSSSGTSFLNQAETDRVTQIVSYLLKKKISP
ncbi:ATP-dependent helicase upf1, partial [Dictyocoela roeselum]